MKASLSVILFLGLGNPGKRYEDTRHNLGFQVIDRLASRWKKRFKKGGGPYLFFEKSLGPHEAVFAKPLTFMNMSGQAAADLCRHYRSPASRLVVISDDFSLPLGKLRLRKRGSDGGHNGLASIIEMLHTQQFARLRMGIGLYEKEDPVDYVLSPFRPDELGTVHDMVGSACDAAVDIVYRGIDWTMNHYN
jgi:PTH1 family peptidyl-tRNA hydrolase